MDKILRSKEVRAQIQPVVERVRADLAKRKKGVMAWEPIPLTRYRGALPLEIRGFGHVKEANLTRTKAKEAALLQRFRAAPAPPALAAAE